MLIKVRKYENQCTTVIMLQGSEKGAISLFSRDLIAKSCCSAAPARWDVAAGTAAAAGRAEAAALQLGAVRPRSGPRPCGCRLQPGPVRSGHGPRLQRSTLQPVGCSGVAPQQAVVKGRRVVRTVQRARRCCSAEPAPGPHLLASLVRRSGRARCE